MTRAADHLLEPEHPRWRVRGSGRPRRPTTAEAALLAGLVATAVVLGTHVRGLYFWADDFDLLFRRGAISGEDVGLLTPHSGHLMAAPILVYRLLMATFGLDSYAPWAIMQICLHLAVCAVTFLLVRRVGARPGVATAASLLIAWWGIGGNAELWSAGMNHSGSLLLGLVAAYVVAGPTRDRRAALVAGALLSLAVAFSLTTVAAGLLVSGYAWQRRGVRFAAGVVSVPAVLLGTWFTAYGREGLREVNGTVVDADPVLSRIPALVWEALTRTLDHGLGLDGLGPVLVVLLVGCLLTTRRQPDGLVALAGAGLAAALLQLALTAYGRYSGGADEISIAVYSYITAVLLAPAFALAAEVGLDSVRRPAWVTVVVVAVLGGSYAAHGYAELRAWHGNISLVSGGNRDLMLGILAAADAGERPLDRNHPDALSPYLLPRYVLAPEIRAALPDTPASPQSRLAAESTFFVGVGPDEYGFPGPAGVFAFELEVVGEPAGGCTTYEATSTAPAIALDTGDGVELEVTSDSTTFRTTLARADLTGPTREWSVPPGVATHVATSARSATLTIAFSAGGVYTVCWERSESRSRVR